jgi:predicted CoA-binding protein
VELRTSDEIDHLLARTRSVAVVGVSPDPARPSHRVAAYLTDTTRWTVYFVNPYVDRVLGRDVYASLGDLPAAPDLVDVFRRAEHLQAVTRQAIEVGARGVWFQLGLVDDVAAASAVDAGLDVVQDHCLRVEHSRWQAYDSRP